MKYAIALLFAFNAFAGDMSKTESYKDAYRSNEDGTSTYIGRCTTHEDYEGKKFEVASVVQKYVDNQDMTVKMAKSILKKVGKKAIKLALDTYFGMLDGKFPLEEKALVKGLQYADDITIDTIQAIGDEEKTFLRMSVGYGGGNGGYIVMSQDHHGNVKKMSVTGDGDLEYCDELVWNF